jgi:hypothetical protein
MSYTKRQLVGSALAEIGLAEYAFDLLPEQKEQALTRLDSMLAEWNARGLRLGYPLPGSPDYSDIDQDAGIPDSAWDAVITNLAMRLAPSYGKTVSADTRIAARHALNTLFALSAMPAESKISELPSGAGNKSFDIPFIGGEDIDVLDDPEPAITFE